MDSPIRVMGLRLPSPKVLKYNFKYTKGVFLGTGSLEPISEGRVEEGTVIS